MFVILKKFNLEYRKIKSYESMSRYNCVEKN